MTFLLSSSIRVAGILLLALILQRILRSRSAALRHWILSAAVFCSVVVPFLFVVVPRRNIDIVVPERSTSLPFVGDLVEEAEPLPQLPIVSLPPASPGSSQAQAIDGASVKNPGTPLSEASASWIKRLSFEERVLWTIWGLGSVSVLAGLALGAVQLFWIARKSVPLVETRWAAIAAEASARYGLRRHVTLLQSERLPVLATWGARHPRLLVPADAAHWPEERIRVAVYHEFAHIHRQDWLVQMMAELQRALYWFNPLAWIVCKRLAQEREQASDDQALASGIDASAYASELLSLARDLHQPGRLGLAAAPMARPSTIEKRFGAMLNPGLNRRRVGRLAALITAVVCLLLLVPLTGLQLRAIAETAVEVFESASPIAFTPAPQANPAAAPTPVTAPASIEGTVVDSATDQPVAGVTVALPDVPGTRISVASDSNGHFNFPTLEAGTYRITTNKQGYIAAHPEARKNPSPRGQGGVFYTVDPGQQLKNVVIRLTPGSIISGRIVDASANPVERGNVALIRKAYDNKGKLYDYRFSEGRTSDRGEFRIVADTGEYYVLVDQNSPSNKPSVYYPGSPDFSRAIPVTVKLGTELRLNDVIMPAGNVDLKKVPVHVRVINETGEAPEGVWSTHWGLKDTYGQRSVSSASFFGGPSKWEVREGLLPGLNDIALGWHTPNGYAFGKTTIQVGNEEITVDLPIRMGVRLTVRAVLEGVDGSATPLAGLRFSFMGHPMNIQFNPSSSPRTVTGDDGLLVMGNVPEIPYDVDIYGLPADGYMIRARQGTRDLLRETAEIAGESLIEVTVGSDGGRLEGSVTNSAGKKVPGARVVIVPETSLRTAQHLYRAANTDQQGRFVLRGIAPGIYKVFSWNEFHGEAPYLNADFMKAIEDKGREIKIGRAQKLTADVRLADEEK